jgi:CIC family chloride channel protein
MCDAPVNKRYISTATFHVSHADKAAKNSALWIRTLIRSNDFFLIPVAVAIGLFSGVVVTGMSEAAQLAHVFIYGIRVDVRLSANDSIAPLVAMTAPALGGLILGIMEWYRRRWKISNAVDPVEANALRGGRLSLRDSIVVSGQTLISNGCGASVGLEAGYAQIGAGAASLVGRLLNLRRNDLRLMVGCGAAGAIAAAFDAPLTGTFYACELIVGVYSVASAAPILAASISATLVARRLGGNTYALTIPHIAQSDLRQYALMMILALCVSLVGIGIMRAAPYVERVFNLKFLPIWLRPVLGGFCVGAVAIVTPQVLAAGHGAMVLDVSRNMAIGSILLVVSLKLSACLISLASGFRGGLFFASLFVGSLIGKLFAATLHLPIVGIEIDPIISSLTAMASLGVAVVGGPLTMSFLVLEMTGNLELTAGVLAACMVTSVFVRGVFGHSFSTWRLHLRGETIRSANDVGWLRNLTVERLMRTDAVTVPANISIADCRRAHLLGTSHAVFLIDGQGRYCGTVLLADLFSSDFDTGANERRIAELAKYVHTALTPNMNIKAAMSHFDTAQAEILPVIDGISGSYIIGYATEGYVRRRYVEGLDQATAGVFY